MKSTILWALIVANAALALLMVGRLMHGNAAFAQPAVPVMAREPGDFLAIPANFTGTTSGVLVVVDQQSDQLSAVSFDDANQRFDNMAKVDLRAIFAAGGTNNPRPR